MLCNMIYASWTCSWDNILISLSFSPLPNDIWTEVQAPWPPKHNPKISWQDRYFGFPLNAVSRWICDWFKKADKNRDGRMNFKEVRDLLKMMNVDMNEHHALRLFTVSAHSWPIYGSIAVPLDVA